VAPIGAGEQRQQAIDGSSTLVAIRPVRGGARAVEISVTLAGETVRTALTIDAPKRRQVANGRRTRSPLGMAPA
jgi:hypothetical protein